MRLRLSQLRRIIGEEVQRTLNEADEPSRVAAARPRSPQFKALRDALGPAEYKRLFLSPQERYGEVSRSGKPRLQKLAMDAFWLGVKPAFEGLASNPDDLYLEGVLEDAVDRFDAAYASWLPSASASSPARGQGSVPRRDGAMSPTEERNATMGYGGTDNPSYPHRDEW